MTKLAHTLVLLAALGVALATLGGCVSTPEQRIATCESLGAGYGTPEFGPCMRNQDQAGSYQLGSPYPSWGYIYGNAHTLGLSSYHHH